MASSYDNDLRLNEQGTGDNSGSWGTVTNLNLEMIAEAFSYGTRVIANAASDNITLADGALDADRSMYLRLSGGGQACTVTFLPNTVSKVWLIENATSATLTFTQGSGANVAVLAGQVKMIATDGAGTGAVVYDLLTDVNLAGTTVMSAATIDDVAIDGKVITMTGSSGDTATLTVAADGALAIATTDAAAAAANISITADGTFTATATTITLDSAGDIILDAAGDEVIFKDGSANIGHVSMDSDNLTIKSLVSDKDIILQGNDGGSGITALTLDMSAAGAATFNSTVTRALTRGSIDVGNSSGVSAPLAKGAANTVLTSDGTDLSFVAASGGGEQTFTASGSISAGNIVGINSSGTVEVMQQELSGVSQLGTATPYMPEYNPIAADTDGNGKVLVVVTVSDGRPLAYVGTVSGTAISFGSAVEVTTATNQLNASVTYDANAGKFLVFWYSHSGTFSNKAVVGTISGTTVSFGSIITVASSSRQGVALYNPDTQSSLILYVNNSYVLYAKVATISGTSVSVGSALTVESGTNRYPRLAYDTTANKYVAAYKYNNAGTAKVLTVSGTSVTAGSRATFDSNTVNWIGTAYNPTANRHIMQYYVGGPVKVVAGTISGTSITFGTPVTLPVTLLSSPYYDPITQKTILTGQSYNLYYPVIFGSGNAITIGEPIQWLFDTIHTSPSGAGPRLVNLNSTRNFWVFKHGTNVYAQVTNEDITQFVGLAKENISNGATGKVTVMGGINTSVSSLTAGKSYGLPTTAAVITEITDLSSVRIFGTALSSTSIYIDKGNLR